MFRVLPITIIVLLAFVAYKSFEQVQENKAQLTSTTLAQQSPAEISQLEPAASGAAEKKEEPKAEKGKDELPSFISKERPKEILPDLTKSGKELLQQMAARRDELEKWEKDLQLRASMVEAASKKLDDKIAKLEELQTATEKLIAEYKTVDDAKMKSMIKIYENMKPQQAAAVFDQLEMPVLLEIVEQMSARRVSGILAKMNSAKAKEVTEKIIKNRDLAKASGIK